DTAQITGATANAGGTITYKLYNNSTCTGTTPATGLLADRSEERRVGKKGGAPGSLSFTFNNAGTCYFYAGYSGDTNNTGPVNSGCAAEPFLVKPNTPQVGTTIVPAPPAGGATIPATAHDTAQITGATANAGGTITYKLYNNSTCTGTTPATGLLAD